MARVSGTFTITSWNEDTYDELEGGGKLTHAWGEQEFRGDITGDGAVHWLMAYRADGSARYTGQQRVRVPL